MREIKLRAWDKLNGVMIYDITDIDFNDKTIGYSHCFQAKFPDQVELMQYTGLQDKNGKEICEGDIIDISSFGYIHQKTYVVKDVFEFGKDYGYAIDSWEENKWKLIGNIHENKDLLNAK